MERKITPKISILYVTNRLGGIDILKDNLDRQTFRDFEVVIVDDLDRSDEIKAYMADYSPTVLKPRPRASGDVWNLNKAYNDGLRACKGELIVFLQDYIWVRANGLERWWQDYEAHPEAFFSGVGHKAKWPERKDNDGAMSIFKRFEAPVGISELDDRLIEPKTGLEESNYSTWELNWACAPRKLMPEFDESMDQHFGGDNVVVAAKAAMLGVEFYIDYSNTNSGYNQSALFPRHPDWEKYHANKGALNDKLCQIFQRP